MSAKANTQNKSVVLRLLAVAFCLYLVFSLVGLWKDYSEGREELEKLEAQAQQTQLNIDEMNDLLENGTPEEIIEKAARDRLGYVYADEKVYVDAKGN